MSVVETVESSACRLPTQVRGWTEDIRCGGSTASGQRDGYHAAPASETAGIGAT